MTGTWKSRVLLWALPIAFAVGFGAGSMATRVAMVPQDPGRAGDAAGSSRQARTIAAAQVAEARPAPQSTSSRPTAQAAGERPAAQTGSIQPVAQAAASGPQRRLHGSHAGADRDRADAAAARGGAVGQRPPAGAAQARPPAGGRRDPHAAAGGLSSEAELTQEARPTKASLREADPWEMEQVTVERGDTLSDILDRARHRRGAGACGGAVAARRLRSAPAARSARSC